MIVEISVVGGLTLHILLNVFEVSFSRLKFLVE